MERSGACHWCLLLTAGVVTACMSIGQSPRAVDFTRAAWQVRLDVDSAPTRRPSKEPTFGSVDFTAHRHTVDLDRAISHRIPSGAAVIALEKPRQYKITLGDSASFDDKIVMIGRAVTVDSIVGTWAETILCCSAGGRFVLWRPTPRGK